MIESFIQLPNSSQQTGDRFITDLLPKLAAEDVFQLWVWDLGKKLFVSTDGNSQYGKSGIVPITDSWTLKPVKFQVELGKKPCVNLIFEQKKIPQLQTIYLDTVPITFGLKSYFLCPYCCKRVVIVYLRHDCFQLRCFKCSHLYYRNTRLNRNTAVGALFRRMHAVDRLEVKEKHLKRRYYKNKPTKRFVGWLKAYAKFRFRDEPITQLQKT